MGILTDGLGNPQPGESDIMVQLSRASKDVKIGCGIGTNAEGRVLVTDVVVDTLAADAGLLNMDEILSVNGKMVHTMNHDDVVKEMTDTLEVEMLIRRKDEEYGALRWQRPEMSDDRETVELTIDRESEEKGFGFGLGITNSGKHFITGKNASLDSCDISVHDEIIAINGEDVTSVDHAEVVRLIFATGLSLALTVLRDPTFDEEEADKFAAMDATGRDFFEVTLSRTDESASFGFGLGTTPQLIKVITSLTDELEANSELRIADIVEEINGTDVTQLDHEECVELVKGSGLKITFKIARTVVEKEGRDFNRRGSIRVVDPALAAEVEDNRTDSIA
jgi:C-terminal processing protease CtpA/Prc